MKRKEEKKEKKKQQKFFFQKKKSGEKSTKFNERNSVLLVKLKHLTQHTTLLRVLREKSRPNALKI